MNMRNSSGENLGSPINPSPTMGRFNKFVMLARENRPACIFLGYLFICLVGIVDYVTGNEFSVVILYLVPISFLALFTGRRAGLLAAIISGFVLFYDDYSFITSGQNHFIPLWNAMIILFIFVAFVYILAGLQASLERERELARTDHLTGAENSRSFTELVNHEISRARRYHHPLTIVYIDLDNFKLVNDSMGHSCGDELLFQVVQTIKKSLRDSDITARLGGDEFAVLLAETAYEQAGAVIAKLRKQLLQTMSQNNWPVTFSIGVVTYDLPPATFNQLIKEVDAVMYSVKNNGKDRICHKQATADG